MPNADSRQFHEGWPGGGYVSDKIPERIKKATVVSAQSTGKGKRTSYKESMTFPGNMGGSQ